MFHLIDITSLKKKIGKIVNVEDAEAYNRFSKEKLLYKCPLDYKDYLNFENLSFKKNLFYL